MATYLGRRGIDTWSTPDERPKDYLSQAFKLWPDEGQVTNVLGGKLGSVDTVTDPHFAAFEESLPTMAWTVNGAQAAGDAVIEIDAPGAEPAKGLKGGDMLMDETSGEVVRVDSDPTAPYLSFVVTRHWNATNPGGAIANDSILRWIGSAYGDGARAPQAVSMSKTTVWNYIQTFEEPADITEMAEDTETRPAKPWPELKAEALLRIKLKMDMAWLFGEPTETTDADGNRLSTTGGFNHFLSTNVVDWVAGASMDDFESWLAGLFKYGSKSKFAVGGMECLLTLNALFRAHSVQNWRIDETPTKVGGMKLTSYVSTFGTITFAHLPQLSESVKFTSWMFVMDQAYAGLVRTRRGALDFRDNVQERDRTSHKGFWIARMGLRIAQEKVHGLAKNLTFWKP